jgi:hypothetical protein
MRTINLLVLSSLACILSACESYKTSFDSCPGNGVPCTSVHNLEKMIVESDCGPDIFLGHLPPSESDQAYFSNQSCHTSSEHGVKPRGRIWVEGKQTMGGSYEEGHYIYFY